MLQPLLDVGTIRYESVTPPAIRLTQKGEQLLGQLWGVVETAEEQILKGFSEPERRQLFDYLRRIQSNCIQIVGEDFEEEGANDESTTRATSHRGSEHA